MFASLLKKKCNSNYYNNNNNKYTIWSQLRPTMPRNPLKSYHPKRTPRQPRTLTATEVLKRIRQEKENEQRVKAEAEAAGSDSDSESEEEEYKDICLADYLTDTSWKEALRDEFQASYFTELQNKLNADYKAEKEIYPPKELIFHAFNLTPLDKVKVVILGQDPYHDAGQAHGLSFSVPPGIKSPPSLWNIFKELKTDIPGFRIPDNSCLEKWAKEGVLLLNATLTVEAHKPNSHVGYGWRKFTDNVIRLISRKGEGVVFLLLGNFAQQKEALINLSQHTVVKTAHPSPLSVKKFFGSKCFSAVNAALVKAGKTPLDWLVGRMA